MAADGGHDTPVIGFSLGRAVFNIGGTLDTGLLGYTPLEHTLSELYSTVYAPGWIWLSGLLAQ